MSSLTGLYVSGDGFVHAHPPIVIIVGFSLVLLAIFWPGLKAKFSWIRLPTPPPRDEPLHTPITPKVTLDIPMPEGAAVPSPEGFSISCPHHFVFLRQDDREKHPGQWHSDRMIVDVFFCDKCLQYRDHLMREVAR